jgi:molybdenum cofactor biosynthesis protein B
MGVKDHSESADREVTAASCHVLTVSDSRTAENDESGKAAAGLLAGAGHAVADRRIVPNDRAAISEAVQSALGRGADLVLALGGTGISKRDVTVDAIRPFIEKELPGFGEMFRALSAREIGMATILSRAVLGATADGKLVAVTPGSTSGVTLALKEILVPQLKHLLRELRKTS